MGKYLAMLGLCLIVTLGPALGAVQAELRFAQPAVDLGRIRAGVPTTHRFTFVCVDAQHVEITDVKSSCGCLAPRFAKRVYQRGEEGTLLVELNTLSQPAGTHVWRVQVVYRSDGLSYQMNLELKAELVTEVTVQPTALIVSSDRAVQREVIVSDIRPRPLLITAVRGSAPALRARVDHPTRDADGRWMCKIMLDVTPEGPDGRREEVLSIFTDDPDYRELRVPVTLIQRGTQALSATPAELRLTAAAGEPIPSQRVLIRARAQRPVSIERVEADNPAVQVQWAQGEHPAAVVKVSVDRTRFQRGEIKTMLQVHVKQPVQEALLIPVTVRVP